MGWHCQQEGFDLASGFVHAWRGSYTKTKVQIDGHAKREKERERPKTELNSSGAFVQTNLVIHKLSLGTKWKKKHAELLQLFSSTGEGDLLHLWPNDVKGDNKCCMN